MNARRIQRSRAWRRLAGATLLALAAASSAASAGSEVYRCHEAGRTVYADRPCNAASEVVAIPAMTPVAIAPREASEVLRPAVTVGMSPKAVFTALGRPRDMVATLEGRTFVEYWTYRSIDGTTRVAFQEGRVTQIVPR